MLAEHAQLVQRREELLLREVAGRADHEDGQRLTMAVDVELSIAGVSVE